MLEDLISNHRPDLIKRCSDKVAERNALFIADTDLFEHGVPLFLHQLVEALRNEIPAGSPPQRQRHSSSAPSAIGREAALHGVDLLLQRYDIVQVVREYGDVCQAVTALAVEVDAAISAAEFRTLNRCLDDAIADAVSAYAHAEKLGCQDLGEVSESRFYSFLTEHRRLIDVAIRAHAEMGTEAVGVNGAARDRMLDSLCEMRAHAQNAAAQIVQISDVNVQGKNLDAGPRWGG